MSFVEEGAASFRLLPPHLSCQQKRGVEDGQDDIYQDPQKFSEQPFSPSPPTANDDNIAGNSFGEGPLGFPSNETIEDETSFVSSPDPPAVLTFAEATSRRRASPSPPFPGLGFSLSPSANNSVGRPTVLEHRSIEESAAEVTLDAGILEYRDKRRAEFYKKKLRSLKEDKNKLVQRLELAEERETGLQADLDYELAKNSWLGQSLRQERERSFQLQRERDIEDHQPQDLENFDPRDDVDARGEKAPEDPALHRFLSNVLQQTDKPAEYLGAGGGADLPPHEAAARSFHPSSDHSRSQAPRFSLATNAPSSVTWRSPAAAGGGPISQGIQLWRTPETGVSGPLAGKPTGREREDPNQEASIIHRQEKETKQVLP
jgi:hypothetical protein